MTRGGARKSSHSEKDGQTSKGSSSSSSSAGLQSGESLERLMQTTRDKLGSLGYDDPLDEASLPLVVRLLSDLARSAEAYHAAASEVTSRGKEVGQLAGRIEILAAERRKILLKNAELSRSVIKTSEESEAALLGARKKLLEKQEECDRLSSLLSGQEGLGAPGLLGGAGLVSGSGSRAVQGRTESWINRPDAAGQSSLGLGRAEVETMAAELEMLRKGVTMRDEEIARLSQLLVTNLSSESGALGAGQGGAGVSQAAQSGFSGSSTAASTPDQMEIERLNRQIDYLNDRIVDDKEASSLGGTHGILLQLRKVKSELTTSKKSADQLKNALRASEIENALNKKRVDSLASELYDANCKLGVAQSSGLTKTAGKYSVLPDQSNLKTISENEELGKSPPAGSMRRDKSPENQVRDFNGDASASSESGLSLAAQQAQGSAGKLSVGTSSSQLDSDLLHRAEEKISLLETTVRALQGQLTAMEHERSARQISVPASPQGPRDSSVLPASSASASASASASIIETEQMESRLASLKSRVDRINDVNKKLLHDNDDLTRRLTDEMAKSRQLALTMSSINTAAGSTEQGSSSLSSTKHLSTHGRESGSHPTSSSPRAEELSLQAEVEELRNTLNQKYAEIRNLEAQAEGLKTLASSSALAKDRMSDSIKDYVRDITSLNATVSDLKTQLSKKADSYDSEHKLSSRYKDEILKLERDRESITAVADSHAEEIESLRNDLASFENKLASANRLVASLEVEVAELRDDLAHSRSKVKTLEDSKSDLSTKVAELSAGLSASRSEVERMNRDCSILVRENQKLTVQVDEGSLALTKARSENNALSAKLTAVAQSLRATEMERDDLSNLYASSVSQQERARTALHISASENQDMALRAEDTSSRLEEARQEIDRLKTELHIRANDVENLKAQLTSITTSNAYLSGAAQIGGGAGRHGGTQSELVKELEASRISLTSVERQRDQYMQEAAALSHRVTHLNEQLKRYGDLSESAALIEQQYALIGQMDSEKAQLLGRIAELSEQLADADERAILAASGSVADSESI